jgi:hypothetical protein
MWGPIRHRTFIAIVVVVVVGQVLLVAAYLLGAL